ncbi:MAG TPA: NUDIX domain-containing protein [Ignavibacteria bacterium]|nr:NUDIX domain-containing protein [Ignavibacteria bacterium]
MKFATLLYIKNSKGEYLLLERLQEPNLGLFSPPGGKLHIEDAESPFACAVREAEEECGIKSQPSDWHLKGIVTEKNYPKVGHIMLFLFEYKKDFNELPAAFKEGKFHFVHPSKFEDIEFPETDKLYFWKFVLNNDNFFSLSIDCSNSPYLCNVEVK